MALPTDHYSVSRFLLATTLLCLLLGGGCRPARGKRPPDVILVTIGALRPDHLSASGYGRTTTPFLDRLAGRGWVFTDCTSVSSRPIPALASLFTGLYPRSHGVSRGPAEGEAVEGADRLAGSVLTLAEALRRAGYATLGVSADGPAVTETGLARGFDELAALPFSDAAAVARTALDSRGKLSASRPVFLWIHCADPNAPYRPRLPWISRYSPNPGQAGEWGEKSQRALKGEQGEILRRPELVSTLVDLYDSEISFVDASLERLFGGLDRAGESLIVVTSDHGEAFGEHGELGHGGSLFQEEVAVPLIVVPPGGKGGGAMIATEASLVDVFPTILDALGLAVPPTLPGRSLLSALEAPPAESGRPLFLELRGGGDLAGMRLEKWKLIAWPRKTESKWALYDLEADPGESRNLAGQEPATFRDLGGRFRSWISSPPEFRFARPAPSRGKGGEKDARVGPLP